METAGGALRQLVAHPNQQPAIYYNEMVIGGAGIALIQYHGFDTLVRVVVWQPERPRMCCHHGEIGAACWYECVDTPGMWVWSPGCLLYSSDVVDDGWKLFGDAGAPVIVQKVLGAKRHQLDNDVDTQAVFSQTPNWLLGANVASLPQLPGSNFTAHDVLHAVAESPVMAGADGLAGQDVVFDGVSWPIDSVPLVWRLHEQSRLVISECLTAAVVAGVFGTYQDGVCTVPLGELHMAAIPSSVWI